MISIPISECDWIVRLSVPPTDFRIELNFNSFHLNLTVSMWTDAANEIAWALACLLSRGQQRERRQQGQTLRYSIKIKKRSGLTDKAHDAEKGLRFNERKKGAHLNSVCVSLVLRASLSARARSVATGSEGKWQTTATERTQGGNAGNQERPRRHWGKRDRKSPYPQEARAGSGRGGRETAETREERQQTVDSSLLCLCGLETR